MSARPLLPAKALLPIVLADAATLGAAVALWWWSGNVALLVAGVILSTLVSGLLLMRALADARQNPE